MIRRETTADIHNHIANHPEVKPTLGYNDDYTDFSPLLDHPESYILLSDGKGFGAVLEWSAPGVWQAHTMALPEARGKGVGSAKEMVEWMRKEGARMVWGMTPKDHVVANKFNLKVGFKPDGEGEDAHGVPVNLYIMEL